MKNLFNFFSKGEIKNEKTINTMNESVTEKLPEIKEVKIKEPRKWDGIKKTKYVYNVEDLSKLLFKTITESANLILNKRSITFQVIEKGYNEVSGFSEKTLTIYGDYFSNGQSKYNDQRLNYYGISLERYQKSLLTMSKKEKKRVNNLIHKLSLQPTNNYRFLKLLNRIENRSTNKFEYSLTNRVELEIAKKRKIYQDIIKHIKMDLPTELKKAKAEYIKTKGDFYKV